ncbi:hypothetical protein LGM71_30060 [Burkholderia sp. AU33545]|uniref:Integrase catalytic subunit n=1 Tax=Burkholderia diffusa TaxID=488732 RepID=A0A6P2R9I8_9BURK|nr:MULTISPECIES: hypothetical protein [Burkholderia]MCA8205287.1 hypothetical protein [Burkholderia sp. AU33545]VWC28431.1 integrase catalytic subunit [Burkholderia diffusa]
MPDWIGSLIDALEFYGGVPELLVPDNIKVLIAKADRYELQHMPLAQFSRSQRTVHRRVIGVLGAGHR